MAVSPMERAKRENERRLQRLERIYDRGGEHHRRFAEDCADIQKLLDERVIDRPHADLLRERAKERYANIVRLKQLQRREHTEEPQRRRNAWAILAFILMVALLWFAVLEHTFG